MNLSELSTTFDKETHDSFRDYVESENDKINKNILKELN